MTPRAMVVQQDCVVGEVKTALTMTKAKLDNIERRTRGGLGPIARQMLLREVRPMSAAYSLMIVEASEQEDNATCSALTGFKLKDSDTVVAATIETSSVKQFENYGMMYTMRFRAVTETSTGNLVLGAIINPKNIEEPFGWPQIFDRLIRAKHIEGREKAVAFYEQFLVEFFCFKAGWDTVDQAKSSAVPRLSGTYPSEDSKGRLSPARHRKSSPKKTAEAKGPVNSPCAPLEVPKESREESLALRPLTQPRGVKRVRFAGDVSFTAEKRLKNNDSQPIHVNGILGVSTSGAKAESGTTRGPPKVPE